MRMLRLRNRLRTSFICRLCSTFSGFIGVSTVLVVVTLGIFASELSPHDPLTIDIPAKFSRPSLEHPLGTDELGRDLLSRLLFGTRIALGTSLAAVTCALVTGVSLGMLAGYSGGIVRYALILVFDIVKSYPALLFAIFVIAISDRRSLSMLIVVIGVIWFPAYARLIMVQTMRIKEGDYVSAAVAFGASKSRILIRHILPNTIGPVFIQAAMDIPAVITFEAALSFLGLGVPPPIPSWGRILQEGYSYVRVSPWVVIFSSMFLILATIGFTFLGEALRDHLDPRLRAG